MSREGGMSITTFSTLADRLIAAKNRPSGFDYMRLVLATLVVATHTINVCYGKAFTLDVWAGPWRAFLALILPMFFALSGFLVAGSLQRCRTLVSFLGLRVIRLVPALAVDTLIGALIIGTIFTTLPLAAYFSDPAFAAYFLNIVGDIHFDLPGVFTTNPWSNSVNSQLWTLPYELICYASLAILAFIGVTRSRVLFWLTAIAANVAAFVLYEVIRNAPQTATVAHAVLVLCFLYGIGLYLYRDKIIWSATLGGLSLVVTVASLLIPGGDYFAALPIAYLTAYLGLMQPKRIKLLDSGDYSYGIFLYGFPIQQAVVASLGDMGRVWYINFLLAYPITVGLAVFSWWCVEKPALRLRPHLLRLEDVALQLSRSIPGGRFLLPTVGDAPTAK